MLHLRARWYWPSEGVFLSRDAVESEPPYLYVRGNPVNRIDPSGMQGGPLDPNRSECYQPVAPGDIPPVGCSLPPKCYEPVIGNDIYPIDCLPPFTSTPQLTDDRDLTFWLFNELKTGIYNNDIQFISAQVRLSRSASNTGYGSYDSAVGSGISYGSYGSAMVMWRQLVRDRARYDFKHKILDELGSTILFRAENGNLLWSEYSLPGNIFFGYIGTRVGFPGWLTHVGAGFAEAVDPAHKQIRNICNRAYLPPDRIPTLGDDPADYQSVDFGIQLWKKYGASLSLSQFRRELQQNYEKFAPPPALPGSGSVPAYPWKNPLGGWPYNVGHFNGSREREHWPPRLQNGFGFYEP